MFDPDSVRIDMEKIFGSVGFPSSSSEAHAALAQLSITRANSVRGRFGDSAAGFALFGLAIALGGIGTTYLAASYMRSEVQHASGPVLVTQLNDRSRPLDLPAISIAAFTPKMESAKRRPWHLRSRSNKESWEHRQVEQKTLPTAEASNTAPEISPAETLKQDYAEDAAATRRLNLQALHSNIGRTDH